MICNRTYLCSVMGAMYGLVLKPNEMCLISEREDALGHSNRHARMKKSCVASLACFQLDTMQASCEKQSLYSVTVIQHLLLFY